MSVDVSPFEAGAATVPLRAEGVARVAAERIAGETVAMEIDEQGPLRLRFPRVRAAGALEAVIVNTGGGVVGGDRLAFAIEAGEGAEIAVTSQAAERVYRSSGADANISVRLAAAPRARLAWLPQESILFDRARVARVIDAEAAPDAALTICEPVVLGRAAMGERVAQGLLRDQWRVRRDGRLVFADALSLDGPIASIMSGPAVAKGAIALATLVHLKSGAETSVDAVRDALRGHEVEAGASAFDGMVIARMLAPDGSALRAALLATFAALGVVVPRSFTL